MNAVTQTEARAINTAAAIPLEAADPTKNLILVPLLSRLVSRPLAATCARRACPFPNSPPASSVSACCKNLIVVPPPMASITRSWPVTVASQR